MAGLMAGHKARHMAGHMASHMAGHMVGHIAGRSKGLEVGVGVLLEPFGTTHVVLGQVWWLCQRTAEHKSRWSSTVVNTTVRQLTLFSGLCHDTDPYKKVVPLLWE